MKLGIHQTREVNMFENFEIGNKEYFEEVIEFAKKKGLYESDNPDVQTLKRCFDRMNQWIENRPGNIRVALYKDFAPYSFQFSLQKNDKFGHESGWTTIMNGGLIFHGSHDNGGDGSAPTFSVNLTPVDGWSIHT
jgi:hypothetical protein